jgi:primosomal protein N' (replication factor Y)
MEQLAQFCLKERNIQPVLIHKKSVSSPKKIERIQEALKHTQIVIGSSLLTRPPQGISFDLIIVLQADQGLQAPSHTAASKTFQMLTELIHHHPTHNIILQTFQPDHPSIVNAARNTKVDFQERDHKHKKEFGYPPYGELCALLTKNKIESRLYAHVHKLYQELMYEKEHQGMSDLEIYPTPSLIYKMYDTYRYQILLKGPNVRTFLENVFWKLNISKRGFKADWNPETIG